jgi:hypothetical protein
LAPPTEDRDIQWPLNRERPKGTPCIKALYRAATTMEEPMTFEQFQSTRQHHDDLGAALADAHWDTACLVSGIVATGMAISLFREWRRGY